jgi:hypothetical protein
MTGPRSKREMSAILNRCLPALAAGCLLAPWVPARVAGDEDALFSEVSVRDRFFDPGLAAPVLVVRTETPAVLDAVVFDDAGRAVRHAGPSALASRWECRLAALPPVRGGIYQFCVVASDGKGKRLGLYPRVPGGGEIVKVTGAKLDAGAGLIRYFLPRASLVRVRAGLQDGPYLDPILPPTPQPSGEQTLSWDGTLQRGLFRDFHRHPEVRITVVAWSLPVNALCAAPSKGEPSAAGVGAPAELTLPAGLADFASPPWAAPRPGAADWRRLDDYELLLELKQTPEPGVVRVHVDCPPRERPRVMNRRFEVMLFVDSVFVMEDEISLLPFTYDMSTRGLSRGKHLVTANLVDTAGVLGTATREFEAHGSGAR